MPENCTIFCQILNNDKFDKIVSSYFPERVHLQGDSSTVHGNRGSLRLTRKVFRERGDDFCRLLLSTCAFVEGQSSGDASVKKRLASHVESCDLVVGVVAEPTFEADERYEAAVFSIAKTLDGVIFNGHEMLDANGHTLVTAS